MYKKAQNTVMMMMYRNCIDFFSGAETIKGNMPGKYWKFVDNLGYLKMLRMIAIKPKKKQNVNLIKSFQIILLLCG